MNAFGGHPNFKLRLILVSIALFLILDLVAFEFNSWVEGISSFLFQGCVFLWIYLLTLWLSKIRYTERLHLSTFLFYFFWSLHFVTSLIHGLYFIDAEERKFSLLDADWGSVVFLFTQFIPWTYSLLMVVLLGLTIGIALVFGKVRFSIRPMRLYAAILLVTLLTTVSILLSSSFSAPFYDLGRDVVNLFSYPPLPENTQPIPLGAVKALDRSDSGEIRFESPYKKILVFVMESVTVENFDERNRALPPESFFRRFEEHSHRYTNFFPNDQDSRTGMLALVTSRFIPFEAYTDWDVAQYRFLQYKRTLLDLLTENGYETAFAVSETGRELVIYDLPWKHKFSLTENDIQNAKGMLCFNPNEYENSCEDKILLSRLLDFIEQHDRVFLFQEFIWGHTHEYFDAAQKSAVRYYSEYLDELVGSLQKSNSLEQTLLVIVSDHGIRDREYVTQLSGAYRIPLIFIQPGFQPEENSALLSQIDFKDILFHELIGEPESLEKHDFVPFVGATGTSLIGAITKELDLLVIKSRKRHPYVLTYYNGSRGDTPEVPPMGSLSPSAFFALFKNYQTYFVSNKDL